MRESAEGLGFLAKGLGTKRDSIPSQYACYLICWILCTLHLNARSIPDPKMLNE